MSPFCPLGAGLCVDDSAFSLPSPHTACSPPFPAVFSHLHGFRHWCTQTPTPAGAQADPGLCWMYRVSVLPACMQERRGQRMQVSCLSPRPVISMDSHQEDLERLCCCLCGQVSVPAVCPSNGSVLGSTLIAGLVCQVSLCLGQQHYLALPSPEHQC